MLTLDDDQDPSNGITIPAYVAQAAQQIPLDFNADNFEMALSTALTSIFDDGQEPALYNRLDAEIHLRQTAESLAFADGFSTVFADAEMDDVITIYSMSIKQSSDIASGIDFDLDFDFWGVEQINFDIETSTYSTNSFIPKNRHEGDSGSFVLLDGGILQLTSGQFEEDESINTFIRILNFEPRTRVSQICIRDSLSELSNCTNQEPEYIAASDSLAVDYAALKSLDLFFTDLSGKYITSTLYANNCESLNERVLGKSTSSIGGNAYSQTIGYTFNDDDERSVERAGPTVSGIGSCDDIDFSDGSGDDGTFNPLTLPENSGFAFNCENHPVCTFADFNKTVVDDSVNPAQTYTFKASRSFSNSSCGNYLNKLFAGSIATAIKVEVIKQPANTVEIFELESSILESNFCSPS